VRRLCGEKGYSAFELIAVMAILGIVMSGITTVFVNGSHAELQNNYRFQAQQTARIALDQLRLDVRGACAANVLSSGSKLLLTYVPMTGTNNVADPTQCGAVISNASYKKVVFCALTSPTVSTSYGLYRSQATDNTCTTANGRLIADRLTTSVLFSTAATIPIGQFQTVGVTLPVSFKEQTFGAPYTLAQTITVRNTVRQTTGATTSCPNTVNNTTCWFGLCPTGTCYPPVIK
jgi:prepilin-type N-terminal cleavage/methylation domain-containing protein